jgi:hypothetical protein
LEEKVISWTTDTVPLANPQGRGVCDFDSGGNDTGSSDDGGGVLGFWFLVLLMFYAGVRVANLRRL